MKTKIKIMLWLTLCNLLFFVSAAYSQQSTDGIEFEPDLRLPSAERRTYYAATVRYSFKGMRVAGVHKKMEGNFFDKLYVGSYTFPYFPGNGPYIGYQAVKIKLLPGYQARVCKYEKTESACETYSDGEQEYHAFAPVNVAISRKRPSDQVELWYGRLPPVVRTFQSHSVIRNPNEDAYLSPTGVWIPAGFWIRLCKAEASNGSVSQCETITTGSRYSESGPYKFIEIGTGTPPSESNSRFVIHNPDVEKSKKPNNLPKSKSLPRPKGFR